MSYYRNRLALVMGASRGIGLEVARGLAARGARVVASSRSAPPLDCEYLPCDATDPQRVRELVELVLERWGTPWFAVNCAGMALPGWLESQDPAECRTMMELNYFGTLHLTRTLLPHLVRQRGGHLVHTASLAGLFGLFGYAGYCASKFAVVGFSQALRRELRPSGVRVSVLCPSNTRTPGLEEENRRKPPEVLRMEEKAATVAPELVARRLLDALPSDPDLVFPTWDGRLAYTLSRVAPWALDALLKR
ncbi:MAG: SDR family oxidoreductase [Candidatus Eremiobacterota bacterium]